MYILGHNILMDILNLFQYTISYIKYSIKFQTTNLKTILKYVISNNLQYINIAFCRILLK